ncbi:MAG: tetratricopeptide repeat protein [Motiliproteus sp.]
MKIYASVQRERGLWRAAAAVGLLVLAGCAGQPGARVPVEERGYGAATFPAQPDAVATPAPVPAAAYERRPQAQRPEVAAPVLPAVVPAPVVSAPAAAGRYPGPAPVLLALIEQADNLQSQGDAQGALAQLERAQRIAPRDPQVYLQLARLRLHMGDRARAEPLARRGLSLSAGDPDLTRAFKALLAGLGR